MTSIAYFTRPCQVADLYLYRIYHEPDTTPTMREMAMDMLVLHGRYCGCMECVDMAKNDATDTRQITPRIGL